MAKQRGYPDRRGMGAQSDFIAEQFVPSEQYKAQQLAMAKELLAAGMNPDQLARSFFIPLDLLSVEHQTPDVEEPVNPTTPRPPI